MEKIMWTDVLIAATTAISVAAIAKTKSAKPLALMLIPAGLVWVQNSSKKDPYSGWNQPAETESADLVLNPEQQQQSLVATEMPEWGVGAPMFTLDRSKADKKKKGVALYVRPGLRALELPNVVDKENEGEMSMRMKPFSTPVVDSTSPRVFTPDSVQTDFDWPSMGGSGMRPAKK